jgi:hypothetical protein
MAQLDLRIWYVSGCCRGNTRLVLKIGTGNMQVYTLYIYQGTENSVQYYKRKFRNMCIYNTSKSGYSICKNRNI